MKRNNAELCALYSRFLESPDGKLIWADLQKHFGRTGLRKMDGVVDPNATIAAVGSREVLLYMDHMRNQNVVD